MSDLDEKLHDLLFEQAKSYYFEGSSEEWFEEEYPELAERFKKAFIDSGYVQIPQVVKTGRYNSWSIRGVRTE